MLIHLHNIQIPSTVYVLEDEHLCISLILGLDFLCASLMILKPTLQNWSSVWTESKGVTNILKHKILTSDEVPVRLSPQKQCLIEEHIRKMLGDD